MTDKSRKTPDPIDAKTAMELARQNLDRARMERLQAGMAVRDHHAALNPHLNVTLRELHNGHLEIGFFPKAE